MASLELDRLIFPARPTQTPPVVVLCNFFHSLVGGCARQDTPCDGSVKLLLHPLKVAFARYLSSLNYLILTACLTASTNLKVFLNFLERKLSIQLDRQKKETVVFRPSASHGA